MCEVFITDVRRTPERTGGRCESITVYAGGGPASANVTERL